MQLRRTDFNGNVLTTISVKSLAFYDRFYSIEPTNHNGYIVVGNYGLGNSSNITGLFKYDAADNKQWEKTYQN